MSVAVYMAHTFLNIGAAVALTMPPVKVPPVKEMRGTSGDATRA